MDVAGRSRVPRLLARLALIAVHLVVFAILVQVSPRAAETRPARPGEACETPTLDRWTEPERWVWERVCKGEKADFNERYSVDPPLDPKSPDGWTTNRALSSAFLETILLHESFRRALTRKGVRIVGAWFRKPVDLAHGALDLQLWLDQSRFEANVVLTALKASNLLSLEGSMITGKLTMDSMEVGGDLNMGGGAEFGEVDLPNAKIGGQLSMIGSRFTGKLIMASIEVGGALFLRGGAEFAEVVLLGAKIDSNLEMDGSTFTGKVDMNSIEVGGALFMRGGAEFGEVVLRGAKIDGQLAMIGSRFTGKLNMDSIEVGGALFMRGGAEFGEVVLRGAKIGDQLSMIGSRFTGNLDMDSIEVGGALLMHGGAEFGDVRLVGAKIGGQLAMIGSKFTGKLNMDSTEVGGALFMSSGAEFGDVHLVGAKIGDQLSMIGSRFIGKLDMGSIEVGGSLFMRGSEFVEPVLLYFSKIGSNLDISSANLASLDLTGARIDGELRLGSPEHDATKWKDGSQLTLRNTVVGALQDRPEAWPATLELEGFTYTRLGGFGAAGEADMAARKARLFIDWLDKDKSYSPQPYEQLASVLLKAGHEGKAGDILYAGRKRAYDEKPLGWGKFIEFFEMSFIGFGYRNWYAAGWVLIFVALGAMFLALSGDFRGKTNSEQEISKGRARWLEIKRIVGKDLYFSFDMILPVIRLRESHYESSIRLRPSVEAYFIVHKIMGYVLASFLIAGLSGLTK